eukprot:COSAG02_NODE_24331_length_691_cov_1.712838_1_plen_37_part_10
MLIRYGVRVFAISWFVLYNKWLWPSTLRSRNFFLSLN